jgi:DNA damage-binding protein 1
MDSAFQTLVLAKSRRLEFRATDATSDTALPIAMSLPVNGRITNLIPMSLPHHPTSLLFIMTVNFQYAVICSAPGKTPYPVTTLAGGHIQPSLLGRPSESAPLAALDPYQRCLVLHLYDGFISILPIHTNYRVVLEAVKGASTASTQPSLLGEPYHLRLEESHILDIQMLITTSDQPPHICLLYQDARGFQHVVVYKLDLKARQLALVWKKQRIDGGSAKQIPLPPRSAAVASTNANATNSSHTGSLLVLGQEQITHLASGKATQVVPLPTSLILGHARLPDSIEGNYRYLLGDEFGNIHMLTVSENDLALDTLGSTAVLSSAIVYMDPAWLFVGSQHGDSQLIQIHAEPHTDGGYLQVLEDYTNLGPIVDMDWVTPQHSASVVTASGSSISGTLRLVRNGIGMKEFAAVELPGIQNMWALRSAFLKRQDAYLVQSFVTETRILGVADGGMEGDDEAATLEEIVLEGLDSSSSSLFVGNVEVADIVLQITDAEIRLVDIQRGGGCIHTWRPQEQKDITVASANEAGQIVVALRGGRLVYLKVMQEGDEKVVVKPVGEAKMTSEVSCLNLNPFTSKRGVAMETDAHPTAEPSSIVTVGLWDDFTVRVLQLDGDLKEILQINLSTEEDDEAAESLGLTSPVRRNRNNMMARSLCLITLDSASANANSNAAPKSSGVDMLFVGLGDGTLISFAVVQQDYALSVQSKKEVSLGTQRIHLVPLQTERGGTCVLATGDRPTVIYLAGGGSRNTPKLCYSNVNLSGGDDEPTEAIAVNVATPFVSPQLFDDSSLSSKHYSLCVSDDSILRLGVIDDIQKLHVTTCRLGMAPRRIVHCPEGRLFCVGCIESGIKPVREASVTDDINMGNCLRFLDDSTFEDVQR